MDGDYPLCHPPCFKPGPYLGEISALSFLPLHSEASSLPLLLSGTGSELLVYNIETGTLLHSSHVFSGVRIHGISVRSSTDPMIAVFGEKKVKLLTLTVQAEPLQVSVEFSNELPRFEHWVLDAKFLSEDGYLALGLCDNSVSFWDIDRSIFVGRLKSAERCLLYSMRLWGESLETLKLASGTIYNEIIVWRIDREGLQAFLASFESNDTCTIPPVHFTRFTGHEGSIFRIGWSSDGSKLVSVSDDRSVRIWMCSSHENFRTQTSNNLVLFGHTARIWDCHLSDSLIITAGEDCTCRIWDFDGNLLLMIKEHVGRGIWRCLYDQSSSLLVTAGFDSAIKVYPGCSSSDRVPVKEGRWVEDDVQEVFTIATQDTRLQGLMNSKSEYVRCLCFAQENSLYVATNLGFLYHGELSSPGDVRWTQLAQVSEGAPIICMDLLAIKSYNSSSIMEYFIAIGDGMGNATVMKLEDGESPALLVLSLTWNAEKERQLLGIYWCVALGRSHIFTVDPRGTLKLWKINYDDSKLKPKASLIAEFLSYFGARIMCLDASTSEEILVCGDQRGNLTAYPLSEGLMHADTLELVQKITTINKFKGAHGISTVSSIRITKLGFNRVEIRTTGGDGCICYFEYDKKLNVLEFVGMKRVKELRTVQSVYLSSISYIDCPKDKYAIGFTSADFIMWNMGNETKVLEISCGGWRRPYSYHIGSVPEYQFCFAYVKDLNIHIHRLWVPIHERKQCTQVLHMQYHGREIHTLCFISFPGQFNMEKCNDLLIATGCEDGTMRLTRCAPLSLESWRESKLLGEHIGGSAVRSICFTSKIYYLGDVQTCSTRNNALDCSETEPFLLISVGAKQVLTSWMLRYRTVDVTEMVFNANESEKMFCSDSNNSPVSFQWLSSHTPPKYASPRMIVDKLQGASEHRNEFVNFSDTKPENYGSEFRDAHENDWRYLAVTAFLVKFIDSRFTTCFVVVSSSDATLSLKALLLPSRSWYDVALLVPQPSPVLSLKHVAVPLCTSANGNNSTHVAHIVISGSTDGSISFWDLTGVVENFMQTILEYKPQLLIDCQRRPKTGRGSQGGRWWKSVPHLTRPHHERTVKVDTSNEKVGNDSTSESPDSIDPVSSCWQKCHSMNEQSSSHHTVGIDISSSFKDQSMASLERKEVLPLCVIGSVHQSGVNCLHVSVMKDSDGKIGQVYCVVSGGDDQALQYLTFRVDASAANSDSSFGHIAGCTEHMQDIKDCQSSESSVIKWFYNNMNNDLCLKILQRQTIKSAHSSSVKGIWTNGLWIFSTGLDQRIRCWQFGLSGNLIERAHLIISVPEPESLDVIITESKRYQIAVAGRGTQIIAFYAPSDEN